MFPHGETIEVLRAIPGGFDQDGDPIVGTVETTVYTGVAVAPRKAVSDELDTRGRAGIVEGFTIYGPTSMDITHTDQIRWRGTLFNVEGEPAVWQHPTTGRHAGQEITIRRAEG